MLKTYRTCNPIVKICPQKKKKKVKILKYKFNNKLLVSHGLEIMKVTRVISLFSLLDRQLYGFLS